MPTCMLEELPMNFTEFMNTIQKQLDKMSEIEKTDCIYKMARMVKEEERKNFLTFLNTNQMDDNSRISYLNLKKEFHEWCSKIEEMELFFEFYDVSEYSDYYEYEEDEVYIYQDPCGLGKEIEERVKQAETLLTQKQYKLAHEIYITLWNLCYGMFYGCDGDYEECYEYDLEQLATYKLVGFDIKRFLINGMYAAYQAESGNERYEVLYKYLTSKYGKEIKLEEMFQTGPEELKAIPDFLDTFMEYLKAIPDVKVGTILIEVLLLRGGFDFLLNHAKNCIEHPIIYWYGFEIFWEKEKYEICEAFGFEGLEQIPKDLVIRGHLAERTACAAYKLHHLEQQKKACLEAFYSQSTVQHFYQLYEFDNYKELTDKAMAHLDIVENGEYTDWTEEETQKNVITKEERQLILFFHGEFDKVFHICRQDKKYLGWSANLKGIIIPLLILLLKKNDEKTEASKRLLSHVRFKIKNLKEEEEGEFEKSFYIWKHQMEITSEQYNTYIEWLESEVEGRTEALVGGGFRNSYFKAELLIVALGETLESNGNEGAKKELVTHYKKIHSRKRAFKEEIDKL